LLYAQNSVCTEISWLQDLHEISSYPHAWYWGLLRSSISTAGWTIGSTTTL